MRIPHPELMASSDMASIFKPKRTKNIISMPPAVFVTTRLAWKAQMQELQQPTSPTIPPDELPSITFSAEEEEVDDTEFLPPAPKKPRLSSSLNDAKPVAKIKRRASSSTHSSRTSSRQRTLVPTPEPIYRDSRSRSTSVFCHVDTSTPRQYWVDEDGFPGPGFVSSEDVVRDLMRTYKSHFKNLNDPEDNSFEPHMTDYPVAELEYPNTGACERFILLAPKDKDHYNPIMCLEQSLYTIIEYYLTPAQQALFGTLPTDMLSDITPPSSPPNGYSPLPSDPHNESVIPFPYTTSSSQRPNYLRLIQRAIRRRDGPRFLQTMSSINHILRSLKYPPLPPDPFAPSPSNTLKDMVQSFPGSRIPQKVLLRIIEETYQRSVGPRSNDLNRYEAFSSEVYGELMPALVSDIIKVTRLNSESLFIDLGSGVGNVVMQASLQTGCRSYGIEIMPTPASIAKEQLTQFEKRCRMWCLAVGEVELEEGDMLSSPRVSELISQADVVLVNNKVFLQSLNEALRPRFLDLKEGAMVVSLKPFVSSLNARVTERNVDDISAIFDVEERPYHSGSVSWGSNSGSYYIHRVDREGYASIRQRFERSRSRSVRSRR